MKTTEVKPVKPVAAKATTTIQSKPAAPVVVQSAKPKAAAAPSANSAPKHDFQHLSAKEKQDLKQMQYDLSVA